MIEFIRELPILSLSILGWALTLVGSHFMTNQNTGNIGK